MTRATTAHHNSPSRCRWALLACVVAAAVWGPPAAASDDRAAAADEGSPAAVDEGSPAAVPHRYLPSLRFDKGEFSLRPRIKVWWRASPDYAVPQRGELLIDRVAVMDENDEAQDVLFALEAPADHPYREACYSESDCLSLAVGVNEETGVLFLYDPDGDSRYHYLNDIPTRILELSAEDSASGHKIYRQARVGPPDRRPDCGDYPEQNEDRYVCLFLAEMLPDDTPETSQTLRGALPDLVQDSDDYSLVFAEEFNGNQHADDSAGCQDGFLTLSADLWNFSEDPCRRIDVNGTPCENVENGHYRISHTEICSAQANTFGKMTYKYGYLEIKYTIGLAATDRWKNYTVFGGGNQVLRYLHDRYGVTVTNMEEALKNDEVELDFFEYVPSDRMEVFHQYFNVNGHMKNIETAPVRTSKRVFYCRTNYKGIGKRHPNCPDGTVTVTKGIEWTPRGYQTHIRVDGFHDDFVLYPKNRTEVQRKSPRVSNSEVVGFGDWKHISKIGFFEMLVPGDESSEMEQVGVSHVPVEIRVRAWGHSPASDEIVANIWIDYIRLYQPADLYTGMEPVYQ